MNNTAEQWVTFKVVDAVLCTGGKVHNVWEVSSHGRIRKNGKIRDLSKSKNKSEKAGGYISAGGTYIHRLVAKYFVPNPQEKKEVNHIDGDKQNNHYTNLEWVTHKENSYHAINVLHKNIGKFDNTKRGICYVWSLYKNDEFVGEFKSLPRIAKYLNVPTVTLTKIFQEGRKTKNGYHFKRVAIRDKEYKNTTQLF
jgi:hypothetical protein